MFDKVFLDSSMTGSSFGYASALAQPRSMFRPTIKRRGHFGATAQGFAVLSK